MLEIVNLVLREGGIACSYAFLGICEAIFKIRDLIFGVVPHIIIYFKDINSFFNLDNMEPAPGCQNKKKIFDSREVYTDMRFHTKK